jgi:hypothetical protein
MFWLFWLCPIGRQCEMSASDDKDMICWCYVFLVTFGICSYMEQRWLAATIREQAEEML